MLATIQHLYTSAVRTALLARDNLTNKWYHIFSVIELRPAEMAPNRLPDPSWYEQKIQRSAFSSNKNSFSFSLLVHDFTSVDAAIAAFNETRQGQVMDGTSNYFFNQRFTKEPSGEFPLVLPGNTGSTDGLEAVLPRYASGTLVWAQIDMERVTENRFKSDRLTTEMKEMSQLTTDWLGFDIWTMPEHIGNIYLQAINPYYRELDLTLSTQPDGIFYYFYLRKNITEKLSLRLIDWHADHVALDQRYEIENPVGFLELPHEPNKVELRIYNTNGHLIGVQGPFAFLKSVEFSMQIKQADFHLTVQDDKGVKQTVIEKYSPGTPFSTGKTVRVNPAYYFKSAQDKRKHVQLEQRQEFVFFPAGHSEQEISEIKEKARQTIKAIIERAKDVCFFCDPYFATPDLIDYVFTIKNTGVKVHILNRRGGSFIGQEKAKLLSDAIGMYNDKPFQKIECRMLKQNLLHDRFIIADDKVWFLGSSFNEIGSRSTCIGKVPESVDTKIIREIEGWFYSDVFSQPIQDYLTDPTDA